MLDRLLAPWKGLPSAMPRLFIVQVILSSGSFVQPFLALLLSVSLSFGPAETGLFLTVNSLAMIPGSLWGGRMVDRFGRKRVLVWARTGAALLLVPCAFLDGQMAQAVLLVGVSIVVSFSFPAIPAMVTDICSANRRSDAFSLLYLGHNLGFALGTTIAGILFTHARPWLFGGEAIMTLITVFVVLFQIPESRPSPIGPSESSPAESDEAAHQGSVWTALMRRPELLAFSGLMALIWLAYSQIWFGLPLWINQLWGTIQGPPLYGILMAFTAVTVLVLTPFMSRLTRRWSPLASVAVGATLIGIGFLSALGAQWAPVIFVGAFVLTAGEILWATGAPAYVANHSPVTHRGRFQAVLNALQSVGSMSGPALGGLVAGTAGLVLLWPMAFGITIVATLGLVVLGRREVHR